jgi:hypothetical protein
VRGQRELAAIVGGNRRIGIAGTGYEGFGVLQSFEAQHLAGEGEGVADAQLLDEVLLELAQDTAANQGTCGTRLAFAGPAADQPNLDHRRLDDGADVHPILLREARVGEAEAAVVRGTQPRVSLVGAQGVAAGGNEIDHAIELVAREMDVRRR